MAAATCPLTRSTTPGASPCIPAISAISAIAADSDIISACSPATWLSISDPSPDIRSSMAPCIRGSISAIWLSISDLRAATSFCMLACIAAISACISDRTAEASSPPQAEAMTATAASPRARATAEGR